ncbi:general substrate transporter [Choanephora cucurbitarum]|nr:general substrate transporter [Choanephora cucurbitarum]
MTSETIPLVHKVNIKSAYTSSVIAGIGGIVCGYDTGSITGILALPEFQKRFFIHGTSAYYQSILLSSFLIFCMMSAFFSGYMCDRLGRKWTILIGSGTLLFGIALEIVGFNSTMLTIGRMISGTGVGLMTNAIPLYQTEIAPANKRGRLISLFALCSSFGQMMGYMVAYGSSYLQMNWSWRAPWCIQLMLCTLYIATTCFLPCSPRWLISQGRQEEGLQVLCHMYHTSSDDLILQDMYSDIVSSITSEDELKSHSSFLELFQDSNLKRTCCALFIALATCFSGNIVVTFYAPQIFREAGLETVSGSLALTGAISSLSLVFSAISLHYWIDSWGRKALFFTGSVISAVCMIVMGYVFHFFATWSDGTMTVNNIYACGIIIFCMVLFSASFAGTWGVANYVYTAEIFSMRCRAKGLSLTYALSWASSIFITFIVPYCLSYSASEVYLFFGACSIITLVGIAYIPETKRKSLEQIDTMFITK